MTVASEATRRGGGQRQHCRQLLRRHPGLGKRLLGALAQPSATAPDTAVCPLCSGPCL